MNDLCLAEADLTTPSIEIGTREIERLPELDEQSDIMRPKAFSRRASSMRFSMATNAPPAGNAS